MQIEALKIRSVQWYGVNWILLFYEAVYTPIFLKFVAIFLEIYNYYDHDKPISTIFWQYMMNSCSFWDKLIHF